MAKAGRKALIKVSGAAVAFTDAATTANGARTEYQITDTSKRVWDPTAPITVERSPDGTTWTTVTSGFTLDRLNGKVLFSVAQASGTLIRVDGSYLPMTTAGEAYEFTYTLEADNQDFSAFQDEWVKRQQGQKDASASLSKWHIDQTFKDKLESGAQLVLEFYVDSSVGIDLKMWAICASDEISASADGLIEESIEFEGTTDMDGRMVA